MSKSVVVAYVPGQAWSLKRTAQCAKCPWIVGADPHDIPRGYCETRHAALAKTIAQDGALASVLGGADLHVMACHEADDAHCVGWLMNQLGPGNNIAMRMRVRTCDNIGKVRLRGEQHQTFEGTLPVVDETPRPAAAQLKGSR